MSKTTQDIVAKLWNRCNILKDGGVSYYQYFIELTYLWFLKMAKEMDLRIGCQRGIVGTTLKTLTRNDELPKLAILTHEAMGKLEVAIAKLQGILKELGEEVSV
jgi:type I restriction-modification system DNA methylase subunit